MAHNSPNEIVLHSEDERFLKALAKRTLNGKIQLSFFERQQMASRLGSDDILKCYDANGNFDLNVAANLMSQGGTSKRISPNVRASESTREGWVGRGNKTQHADVAKAMGEEREGDKARCHRYCKAQGNTSCRYCHGAGYEQEVTRRVNKSMGINRHAARDVVHPNINVGD